MRRPFRTPCLSRDQFSAELIGKTRDDLVLHVEEVGYRFFKSLRPDMIASFGIDKLDIDAHAIAAALHGTLQRIAHSELATDRLHVDVLTLVGKGRVARDHETSGNA